MTGSYAGENLFKFCTVRIITHPIQYVYTAWIFTVVGIIQMAIWAAKKHNAYKKEFGVAYPRDRKVMIPFIF
jgi:hypothetical protein